MIHIRNMLAMYTRSARIIAGSFLISAIGLLAFAPATFAAALASTNVEPASLVAGSTSTVTVSFGTTTTIPANGKIKVTFGANFNVSTAGPVACPSMDGSFTFGVSSQTVTITRSNDGTPQTASGETCTIGGIVNPQVSGSTGTYTIQTTDSSNVVLDQDAAVTADTITPASLSGTNVQPASLVAGASTTVTINFATVNPIGTTGKIKVTFPSGFNISGATGASCTSGIDGSVTPGVSGQVLTLTRNGDGSPATSGSKTCSIGGIVNPQVSGSTGTYTIQTTDAANNVVDQDTAVAADTITAGALSSTNVQPATTVPSTTNVVTVSFTTANPIPSTGKIKVTFGSLYNVTGAASGTCSTMDGSFATGVSGQVVTITRSAGTSQSAAAETCTISGIVNPTINTTTGTYTITTTDASNATIDTDTAVTADYIFRGTTSSTTETPAASYDIVVTAPNGGESLVAGDETDVTWTSTQENGSAMTNVNLSYSTDGGDTWVVIATGDVNDGSYTWTVPSVDSADVWVKVEGTDLAVTLDSDTSDEAFTIASSGSSSSDSTDTSSDDSGSGSSATSDLGVSVGDYIKSSSSSAVYVVAEDADGSLVRDVFMTEAIYFTWQDNFDNVVTVSDSVMEQLPLGSIVLPKAGVVLLKFESVAAVYAIEGDSTIRWITSEDVATANYGADWADYVLELPPTMYHYFTVGTDMSEVEGVDTSDMKKREDLHG